MSGRKKTTTTKKMNATVQAAIVTTVGAVLVALITGLFGLFQNNALPPTSATPLVLPSSTFNPTTTTTLDKKFGPENGELKHDGVGGVEWKMAKVSLRNFVAEATFINPYSSDEQKWDIDFFFRRIADITNFRIGISSDGVWGYGADLPEWKGITSDAPFDKSEFNLRTGAGEANTIRLVAFENQGCFYLNGKLLGELTLSLVNQAGDVAVAIGSYGDSEREGAVTRYEEFTVYQLSEFIGC